MSNPDYQKIYKRLITDNAKLQIIEYSGCSKTFTYKPFSHQVNIDALDDLYELIIDNTVFYAFTENEVISAISNHGLLGDLKNAAKHAFDVRLPKGKKA